MENTKSAKQNNSRKSEIAICSVFFCIAVLIIHALSEMVSHGNRSSLIFAGASAIWRLCHFATYGFVFLAGVRFMLSWQKKDSPNAFKYYLSRVLRILPLYILWCAVYYAYSLITTGASFSITDFLYQLLLGSGERHLYFIPVLLQLTLLAPVSALIRKKLPSNAILLCSLLLTFIFGIHLSDMIAAFFPSAPAFEYSDRIFTSYLIFWSVGCSVGQEYEGFCKALDKAKLFVFVGFTACAALDLSATYLSFVADRFVWCLQDISVLYVLFAIMLVFSVSRNIASKNGAPAFFERADLAGYLIYLSHILPLEITALLLSKASVSITASLFIRLGVLAMWMLLCSLVYRKKLDRYHAKKS